MRIIIDGDATPSIKLIESLALKYNIEMLIYCDFNHSINSDYSKIITVDQGFNNVDMIIVNSLIDNDIVITQDYGLASIVISKNCFAINPNGTIYNSNNIDYLLLNRFINLKNKHKIGPKKRTKDDDKRLLESIEKVIYGNSSFRNNTRNS